MEDRNRNDLSQKKASKTMIKKDKKFYFNQIYDPDEDNNSNSSMTNDDSKSISKKGANKSKINDDTEQYNFNNYKDKNDKYSSIGFKEYELNEFYVVTKEEYKELEKIKQKKKITENYCLKFYDNLKKIKNLFEENIDFCLVKKKYLKSIVSINDTCYKGKEILLFKEDQKSYFFFPKENKLLELHRKDLNSKKKK